MTYGGEDDEGESDDESDTDEDRVQLCTKKGM